jgi:hypothetical protein
MSDQQKLFGLLASVPTAWLTLAEIGQREPVSEGISAVAWRH